MAPGPSGFSPRWSITGWVRSHSRRFRPPLGGGGGGNGEGGGGGGGGNAGGDGGVNLQMHFLYEEHEPIEPQLLPPRTP